MTLCSSPNHDRGALSLLLYCLLPPIQSKTATRLWFDSRIHGSNTGLSCYLLLKKSFPPVVVYSKKMKGGSVSVPIFGVY